MNKISVSLPITGLLLNLTVTVEICLRLCHTSADRLPIL